MLMLYERAQEEANTPAAPVSRVKVQTSTSDRQKKLERKERKERRETRRQLRTEAAAKGADR